MKYKKKILIIEDERGLQITLEDRLQAEGYEVGICGDGIEGEDTARSGIYDLILIDVMLPSRDGFSICQNLRKSGIDIPILMLTARNTSIDTVMGLKVGADDYLAKPFDMQVLLARIEALLRRTGEKNIDSKTAAGKTMHTGPKPGSVQFGTFTLDFERGVLERSIDKDNKVTIDLNALEYRLLEYLTLNSDRIISRNMILDEVWGYDSEITTRTVDVHIAKLRQKLGESELPRHILTFRGRGYKFVRQP